jgi:holo-[acyl-carrier protein] synthase
MIVGVGNDIVNMGRIEKTLIRFGDAFLHKAFTPYEIAYAAHYNIEKKRSAFFAKRFAAKEACAKALGTGFRNGIRLKDIEVVAGMLGKPELVLYGRALERVNAMVPAGEIPALHLALSDDYPFAYAVVIVSC